MRSDDDTFLSAYLDGQLDANQRHLVDSALVSCPDLAERLRALTVVRDLVVGLPREAGLDVTPLVMHRIRLQRRSQPRFSAPRPWNTRLRRAAAAAGILTVAAGLMLVVTLTALRQPRVHRLPPAAGVTLDNAIAEPPSTATADADADSVPVVALQPQLASSAPAATHSVALTTPPATADHGAAATDRGGTADSSDQVLSRTLLDNPGRRRFFLIKNGRDGKAQQQVASVVEHATRFGFVKITISQGIVIDPRHPGEATVFALLVNPRELDRLRDQLRVALPDVVEEKSTDPGVVTQLADIRQVQGLAPAPLGDVSISHEALALRTRVGSGGDEPAQPAAAVSLRDTDPPTAEQFGSAPVPAPPRPGSAGAAEHGTELAAADTISRGPDASAAAGAHSLHAGAGAEGALSRPDSAATSLAPAKSDDVILVFVWICKPRAS